MTTTTRTRFTDLGQGRVDVIHENSVGDVVTTRYECPSAGGLVRLSDGATVCDRLATAGHPLRADADSLLAVIRAEWRKARAHDRRQLRAR